MTRASLVVLLVAGCSGTTGSRLVQFSARARGSGNASFDVPGLGYHVSLTSATLHVGALYLNVSRPSSGGGEQPCILPGIYDGEAFAALDVDLLSAAPQPFARAGAGTANCVLEADLWLTGGDVNAADDPTPILTLAGTATRGGSGWPFSATVTIGANRRIPPANPGMPGSHPICRQRIVSLVDEVPRQGCDGADGFLLSDGGTVDLAVDVAPMFNAVDFAALTPAADGTFVIPDDASTVGSQLYDGLVRRSSYHVNYTNKE